MNKHFYHLPLVTAVVIASAPLAQAQQLVLEEVVVTAQKREQNLEDVPISIVAMSGAAITDRGIESLATLSASVPGLNIAESQIDSTIQIRGVQTGANKGFEQSVAMYVDGLYYGRSQLIRLPLIDLNRVEVLRGPQPTLFGKNAIAGAVSVWTERPTDELEGSIALSYEFEQDEPIVTGIVSGPLTDTLRGRLVASYREMDGWVTNQVSNQEQPNIDETVVRGTIAWDATDDLTISLKGEYAEFNREGWALELHTPVGNFSEVYQGPFYVETKENYRNEAGDTSSKNKVNNFVFNVDYALGDYALNGITGWADYNTDEFIDVDYSRLILLDGTNQGEDFDQFSQEIRLTSPGGEKVDWITGVYYQDSNLKATDQVKFGETFLITPFAPIADSYTDRLYEQSATLWSVFAQADINWTESLTLTVGGRYNWEDKDGRRQLDIIAGDTNTGVGIPSPVPPYDTLLDFFLGQLNMYPHDKKSSRSEDHFNPLVNLQYHINDEVMTYISYANGTKAGGFDIRGNSVEGNPVAVPGTFEFEDEEADSYEIGAKFNYDRAALNLAVYYTEYTNLQTQIFDGSLSFLVTNASEATTQGVEADGRLLVTDYLQMYAAVAYNDFEYDSFENGTCAWPDTGTCSLTGERPPLTPEWKANLGFDFNHEITDALAMDANLNLNYTDDYYGMADLDKNSIQDSYVTVDAVLGLSNSGDNWRVSFIGRNLTDERIRVQTGPMSLSTTFTQGAGKAYDSLYARPRSYTLKLEYKF